MGEYRGIGVEGVCDRLGNWKVRNGEGAWLSVYAYINVTLGRGSGYEKV